MTISRRLFFGAGLGVSASLVASPVQAAYRPRWVEIKGLAQGRVFMARPVKRKTKPGIVVFHHGAGGNARAVLAAPGHRRILESLVNAGYLVLVSDFGGTLWGNNLNHKYIKDLIKVGQAKGGRPGKIVLVGASMGGGAVLSYAGLHPAEVAGVVGIIPAIDLQDIDDKFGGNFVDSAYKGNYRDSVEGKNRSPIIMAKNNHVYTPNNAKTSRFSNMPVMLYYADQDAITIPEKVNIFIGEVRKRALPRVQKYVLRGDHSDATMAKVPLAHLSKFVKTNLPA